MHFACLADAETGIMTLPEEESKHCVRVLRMEAGTAFRITNGSGEIFDAVMREAHPKKAVVELSNPQKGYDYWPFKLCVALAPTKNNDRLEWFLEKATEIGIDEIFLFQSYHSERRQVKPERLQKVLVAALKQSLKSRLPKLHDLQSFNQFIKQDFQGRKFIAWIDEGVTDLLANTYKKGENCLVLIGPEGDFSPEEVSLAKDNGFEAVSLGEARLRTETAALAACHSVQLINQIK